MAVYDSEELILANACSHSQEESQARYPMGAYGSRKRCHHYFLHLCFSSSTISFVCTALVHVMDSLICLAIFMHFSIPFLRASPPFSSVTCTRLGNGHTRRQYAETVAIRFSRNLFRSITIVIPPFIKYSAPAISMPAC